MTLIPLESIKAKSVYNKGWSLVKSVVFGGAAIG